jgi:hypothetical protein
MAAVDLSATSSFPFIKVISSVGTTQQEVNLPPGKLRVSVGSDVEVLLATSGVSDGAAMPADKLTIAANNLLELELSNSSQDKIDKIAVAASTGTAAISIVLERA